MEKVGVELKGVGAELGSGGGTFGLSGVECVRCGGGAWKEWRRSLWGWGVEFMGWGGGAFGLWRVECVRGGGRSLSGCSLWDVGAEHVGGGVCKMWGRSL